MHDDEGQHWAQMQAEAEAAEAEASMAAEAEYQQEMEALEQREALRVLSDCVIMLDNYLANDAQMDDVLVRQALHFADVFKTKATATQE